MGQRGQLSALACECSTVNDKVDCRGWRGAPTRFCRQLSPETELREFCHHERVRNMLRQSPPRSIQNTEGAFRHECDRMP